MKIDLKNQIALVTGAGAGIGQGCAQMLAEAGAHVVVTDIDQKTARVTARIIRTAGHQATALGLDVADEASVARAVKLLRGKFGRLHVLVNNAGINAFKGIADTSPADWDQIHRVDLRGVYLVTRATLPLLTAAKNACVINIASVHAQLTMANITAYAAAKGGVVAMVRSLAQELGPAAIRVNSISPGFVHTPMLARWLAAEADPKAVMDRINGFHPVGRIGTPEDIGRLVAFLASPLAAFITGQNITIDGGLTTRLMH